LLHSNNRITTPGALCIAKGLEGNNTLEVLKVICADLIFLKSTLEEVEMCDRKDKIT